MALLFMDGFDCYGTGDISSVVICKWFGTASSLTGITGQGELGNALRFGNAGNILTPRQEDKTTLIVGFYFRRNTLGASTGALIDYRFSGNTNFDVRINSSDKFVITRSGTVIGTGSTTIAVDTWYFVEVKGTPDNSGSAELRINGSTEINVSSVDLQNSSNSGVNEILLSGAAALVNTDYDDFFLLDTSGSTNNDFLGEIKIETIKPDGIGNTTEWTATGAANNYEAVDDTASDGDTTYVEETGAQKDVYAFGAQVTNGTRLGIQISTLIRKTDVGAKTYFPVSRVGGTDYDGTEKTVYDDYQYGLQIVEDSPATSSAWTRDEIDTSEFGQRTT